MAKARKLLFSSDDPEAGLDRLFDTLKQARHTARHGESSWSAAVDIDSAGNWDVAWSVKAIAPADVAPADATLAENLAADDQVISDREEQRITDNEPTDVVLADDELARNGVKPPASDAT